MWMAGVATVTAWIVTLSLLAGVLRGPGLARRLRRIPLALVCGVMALLLSGLLAISHALQAFSDETLVAQVAVRRLGPDHAEVTYHPAQGGAPRTFRLQGDQWAVSGGMIKWHPWLTAMGLKSYHKPMRISGQFSSLQRQRAAPPTVFALEPGTDLMWDLVYRLSPVLPFIEAVYGSSAYAYLEPEHLHAVYVTPSGYLIKRQANL